MSIDVKVPISTEGIESNLDCKIRGFFKEGIESIEIDSREQNHHQRLGIRTKGAFPVKPGHRIDGCNINPNS